MCVVGAVGYFVVKKKSAAGIAAAVGMRDDVSATAKPMDPTPEVNISTPSTGTDSQGMEGSKSGSKKKKKKGSKRKKQKKQ
uniref:Bm14748 n=1 Tax=Brugia malayi TaxID=6279 RepID=A0A0J9XWJ3_BRUMA|nr:Bm14748 [Brugia malayi]